jgi:hypothetical protein
MVAELLILCAEESGPMPVVKITGQGLFAIGLSVALLWACLIGERLMLRNATSRRVRVLHQIEKLQRKAHPQPSNPHPMITVA